MSFDALLMNALKVGLARISLKNHQVERVRFVFHEFISKAVRLVLIDAPRKGRPRIPPFVLLLLVLKFEVDDEDVRCRFPISLPPRSFLRFAE